MDAAAVAQPRQAMVVAEARREDPAPGWKPRHCEPGHPDTGARLVEQIDTELRARGASGRGEHEKAYLKSELTHYGTSVPAIRPVAKTVASQHPGLRHDDLVMLIDALWKAPIHERRMAAVELLGHLPRPLAERGHDPPPRRAAWPMGCGRAASVSTTPA